jgi:hypothetical protein
MKKSDHMGVDKRDGSGAHRSSSRPTDPYARALQRMSTVLGPVLAVAFVAVALVGTISASWFGSLAFVKASGMDSARAVSHFTASFTTVATAFEILKLALATQLGIGRLHHQIIALLLWAICVAYGWLMPVLLLVHVPIWPATGDAVFLCAVVWAFVQAVSGLLPAARWSTSDELGVVDHPPESTEKPVPIQPADPAASAAGMGPTPLDDDGWFNLFRKKLAGQPGSKIGRGVRIGQDGETIGSQHNLAMLVGVSKATVNRHLHQLDRKGRLSLETYDGITRIFWP